MRIGLWDRQGTNIASRAAKKCMAKCSFAVKSSVFGRRITHFRRDFVRSGGD